MKEWRIIMITNYNLPTIKDTKDYKELIYFLLKNDNI